ncbi:MAG: type restriction enzyme subunit [Thermotogota bacterium]|nr:type restriction enzyme subunit [Thermotogota bacterium]
MNFKNLPETWKVVRLGRVAEIVLGKTPHRKNKEYWDNGVIPWVKIQDMTNKVIYDTSEKISKKAFKEVFHNNLIPKGTLIMSFKLTIGRTAFLGVDAVHNEAIVSIFPNPDLIDKNYLFYLLPSLNYSELTGGAAKGETLNKEKIQNLLIPLPPLPEQKRIVEILSLAEELIRKQKEAISLIDKILMAKFLEMFGDPATNPKGWEVEKFEDIVDIFDSQRVPVNSKEREKRKAKAKKLYPYYGANGQVDWINDHIFDGEYLLIAEDGGFWGAFERTSYRVSGKFWVNNHAHIVRGKEGIALNEYLELVINILDVTKFMSGTTRGKLTQSDMKRILIPLPPIELQKQFAQIVEEFEKKREEMQKTLETLESLFKFLQKKAFTGELTAEWREQNKIDWELPRITERQAVLLATLYYYQNIIRKPAMVTVAMKSAFLLQQEAGLNLDYNFIPYKYGPFSKEVYEDIEELERNFLVERMKPKKDIEMTEIRLIDEFKDWTERIIDNLPQKIKDAIKTYVEKYGKMELNELLDYVYAKYPEYAVKSKRKRGRR